MIENIINMLKGVIDKITIYKIDNRYFIEITKDQAENMKQLEKFGIAVEIKEID